MRSIQNLPNQWYTYSRGMKSPVRVPNKQAAVGSSKVFRVIPVTTYTNKEGQTK